MTADDLAAVARALYGDNHSAIRALADDLGVSLDTMRRVLNGRAEMPAGWSGEVLALVERRASELGDLAEKLRRMVR